MIIRNNTEVWFLAPRTASRYINIHLKRQRVGGAGTCEHVFDPGQNPNHSIVPDRIADRKVILSIRNPYSRIQSWWRYITAPNRVGTGIHFAGDFSDYIRHLDTLEALPKQGMRNNYNFEVDGVTTILSMTDFVEGSGVSVDRINDFCRYEDLDGEIERHGLTCSQPVGRRNAHGWAQSNACPYDMEWYDKYPEAREVIGRLFHDDFVNFDYEK